MIEESARHNVTGIAAAKTIWSTKILILPAIVTLFKKDYRDSRW